MHEIDAPPSLSAAPKPVRPPLRPGWGTLARTSLASLSMLLLAGTPASATPNVVLFLVDDLGWSDLGCYGNDWIETPQIDAFADSSVRFTEFYAAGPVCSPSRAAIQSGQYPTRFQLTAHIPGHFRPFAKLTEPPNAQALPSEIVTLGEALASLDYRTAYFGKWHLGWGAGHDPRSQGYIEAIETRGRHFAPSFQTNPPIDPPPPAGTYQAGYLTKLTSDFIRTHADRPFFVTCSHFGVHTPLQAEQRLIDKYQAKAKSDPDDLTHPVYAAMVEHIDESFGNILTTLEELELAQNTIVIFTSDNGGLYRAHHRQGPIVTSNAPLRGGKGSLYEGGIRIPTLIRWPGVSQPGQVCDEPASGIDFFPTLLQAVDAMGPEGQLLDGHTLVPLLRKPDSRLNREELYWHYPHYHTSQPASAIRAREWKLLYFWEDGSVELYHLPSDPGERRNLAAREPARVRHLLSELRIWREETGALTPYWNERHQPTRAAEWWRKMDLIPLDLRAIRQSIAELPFDRAAP